MYIRITQEEANLLKDIFYSDIEYSINDPKIAQKNNLINKIASKLIVPTKRISDTPQGRPSRPLIITDAKTGKVLFTTKTFTEACKLTKVAPSLVSEVLRGDLESYKGYIYRDVESKEDRLKSKGFITCPDCFLCIDQVTDKCPKCGAWL